MTKSQTQIQNSKLKTLQLHSIDLQSPGNPLPPHPQSTFASASSSSPPTLATPKESKACPSDSSPKPNISAPANRRFKTPSPPNSPTARSNSSETKAQNENSPTTVSILNVQSRNSVNKPNKSPWERPTLHKPPTKKRNVTHLAMRVLLMRRRVRHNDDIGEIGPFLPTRLRVPRTATLALRRMRYNESSIRQLSWSRCIRVSIR